MFTQFTIQMFQVNNVDIVKLAFKVKSGLYVMRLAEMNQCNVTAQYSILIQKSYFEHLSVLFILLYRTVKKFYLR